MMTPDSDEIGGWTSSYNGFDPWPYDAWDDWLLLIQPKMTISMNGTDGHQ